jgi:glycosyltransferase involved in cell wall biosynthesis
MADRTKPIRVCIVAASTDIIGGQAIQAQRLIEDLSRESGIEATLLPINPRLPFFLSYLQRVKYLRTLVTSIAYILTLLVRLPRFDVIHVFSASYFSFLLAPTPAVLLSKFYGKSVLINYHSGEAEDHLKRWRRTVLPIIDLADRVIVPSEYLVEVFARFGVCAKAIYNTVDPELFKFRKRQPLRPVLLSNRNLEQHYNISCTLRAFSLIEKQVKTAKLLIAGLGRELAELQELAGQLQIKNVEFIGAVAPERMPSVYDSADIFVNASNVDNMPLSIIEAFACGLPVVTTNAGGIKYMVNDRQNGLLVSTGDHAALASCIIDLLNDPEYAEQIVNAARMSCRDYTWNRVRSEWLSVYAELAGRPTHEFEGAMSPVIGVGARQDNS